MYGTRLTGFHLHLACNVSSPEIQLILCSMVMAQTVNEGAPPFSPSHILYIHPIHTWQVWKSYPPVVYKIMMRTCALR